MNYYDKYIKYKSKYISLKESSMNNKFKLNFIVDKNLNKCWNTICLKDLNYARDRIKYIYAIADTVDLDGNYKKTLKLCNRVSNFTGYYYTLKYFVNSFLDEHMKIKIVKSIIMTSQTKYPGFITIYENKQYIVQNYYSEIPNGSLIIEIDGKHPNKYLNEFIKYEGGVPDSESSMNKYSPYMFISSENPFINKPKVIRYTYKGTERIAELEWKLTPTEVGKDLHKITNKK